MHDICTRAGCPEIQVRALFSINQISLRICVRTVCAAAIHWTPNMFTDFSNLDEKEKRRFLQNVRVCRLVHGCYAQIKASLF